MDPDELPMALIRLADVELQHSVVLSNSRNRKALTEAITAIAVQSNAKARQVAKCLNTIWERAKKSPPRSMQERADGIWDLLK